MPAHSHSPPDVGRNRLLYLSYAQVGRSLHPSLLSITWAAISYSGSMPDSLSNLRFWTYMPIARPEMSFAATIASLPFGLIWERDGGISLTTAEQLT